MLFTDPQYNLVQFGLSEGAQVVDVGAGSGVYSLRAAALVGGSGRVYAIDVQKYLLTRIRNTARESGFKNVEVVWGDIELSGGTTLRDQTLDAIIVSNVLFQLEDKEAGIDEMRRVLKDRGRALVIDWRDSFGNMGPRVPDVVSERAARELFERHGLSTEREIEAGKYHYGLVMRKT